MEKTCLTGFLNITSHLICSTIVIHNRGEFEDQKKVDCQRHPAEFDLYSNWVKIVTFVQFIKECWLTKGVSGVLKRF